QNYPNPFNPATMINFSLPLEVYVSIKIYDMLGREVKTLLAEIKESGFYSIKWNGDNGNGEVVAAGSYIYRITAGSFIQTKKMIFLK
ncbi:MAG: T9SS type A sorting domain-containing protein, partial [Ignavibacteriaceae bacterium]|nr:T9SS type A sorting domain-containing protein [Ignavibacteriaceae bacterium]